MAYKAMIMNLFEKTYEAEQRFYSSRTMKLSEREGAYIEYHTLYMQVLANNLETAYAAYKKWQKKKTA